MFVLDRLWIYGAGNRAPVGMSHEVDFPPPSAFSAALLTRGWAAILKQLPAVCLLFLLGQAFAADLKVLPAHIRSDPFGQIVEADRSAKVQPAASIDLTSARDAYVSCRLGVGSA